MSHACTPILVGIASPVSEILLLSIMAKFPFRTMGYSPWSSKNLIDQNRLKKFIQVGIDVKCMHTNFGGHSLSGYGDNISFHFWPNFPFGPWTIVHGCQKLELAQKVHASYLSFLSNFLQYRNMLPP